MPPEQTAIDLSADPEYHVDYRSDDPGDGVIYITNFCISDPVAIARFALAMPVFESYGCGVDECLNALLTGWAPD